MKLTQLMAQCQVALTVLLSSLVGAQTRNKPDILVVILASNEEHTLPTFFGCFEKLSYPKDAMELLIRSDHNRDNTPFMLDTWTEKMKFDYFDISLKTLMLPTAYEESGIYWPYSRYATVIEHKEEALIYARTRGIQFVLFLDTDAFITNQDFIQDLIVENKTVVAPLLASSSLYSNFWGEMDKKGYYIRSTNYADIVERNIIGSYSVPLVHSAVLVNLKEEASKSLTFVREKLDSYESIPQDDIITFARSAQKGNVEQFVTNKKEHGWILMSPDSLEQEIQDLVNLQLEVSRKQDPLPESDVLKQLRRPKTRDSLGVDQVYLINLNRRPDRLNRMNYCFEKIGILNKRIPAVDGKALNAKFAKSLGIQQLPLFRDPHKNRNLTFGEIGCFLSHYNVWLDIVENKHNEVVVFEDDVHFEPNFRARFAETLGEIRKQGYLDFVYVGRKRLVNASEPHLQNTERLVHVDYSYWTLSYYITRQGAQKLIDGKPLSKMVPVDEYIPIMFDKHTEHEWKSAFAPRTLRAASAHPLLVHPTHYTGEEDYISDTEQSALIEPAPVDVPVIADLKAKDEL